MNFQARLQHNTRGVFDASVNESYERILIDYLEQPYVQRWWAYARALYGDAFCEHCDQLIERIEKGEGGDLINWKEFSSNPVADKSTDATGEN